MVLIPCGILLLAIVSFWYNSRHVGLRVWMGLVAVFLWSMAVWMNTAAVRSSNSRTMEIGASTFAGLGLYGGAIVFVLICSLGGFIFPRDDSDPTTLQWSALLLLMFLLAAFGWVLSLFCMGSFAGG
jgi:hypothetical protein